MPDEIDREITTKKVVSNPNTSVDGYSISEQRTTRVNNDNSAVGLILGVLLTLGLGGGAVLYYLNNRPTTTQIVPGPTNTVKEKSTTIEHNNTTTKEVNPATQQPTPNVEINIPAPVVTTQPQTASPVPAPAATTQPQTASPATPAATAQPQTTSPTPANR
jgi:hypothetical protein